jgi:hypothetical protein
MIYRARAWAYVCKGRLGRRGISGVLDQRYDDVDDIARARRVPSLQLAGTPDRSTLDLNALTAIGVKIVGRLADITESGKAQFAGSLATCVRFLISRWAGSSTSSTRGRMKTASTTSRSHLTACQPHAWKERRRFLWT